jgi:hypothetical protein
MGFGLQNAQGDLVLTLTAQGAGTVTSGAIAAAGAAAYVQTLAHVSAIGGTPSLALSLEGSANGSTGWSAIAGSALPALTAVGNAAGFAVTDVNYVRVTATVTGTTPTVTAKVAVLVFAE